MSETQTVLVTGAAGGIGRACAEGLAAEGHRVVALDLSEAALAAALPGAGDNVALFAGNVADAASCAAAVGCARERFGGLDALVHFAATHSTVRWEELTADEMSRVLSVNVTGSFLMAQAAARHMVAQRRGAIVLTASSVIHVGGVGGGGRGGPAYASSKAAIIALTRSFARALGPDGIRVNAIAPGTIETPMIAEYSEDDRAGARGRAVLGRIGRPEEIADAARFLISDRASFITGEVVNVNGGGSFN